MILKNKTSSTQEITLLDQYGEKYITLLKAGYSTEISDHLYSKEIEAMVKKGILSVDGLKLETEKLTPEPIENEIEEIVEPLEEVTEEDPDLEEEDVAETEEDTRYQCPYCDRDYATEANLTKHINKTHPEESK